MWMGCYVASSLYSIYWDVYVDFGCGIRGRKGLREQVRPSESAMTPYDTL